VNINALLAAAIHERYSDPSWFDPCSHTSGGECERFADVLLATPSGQALVAHVTALETALRDTLPMLYHDTDCNGGWASAAPPGCTCGRDAVVDAACAALEGVEP
jgi:hypothetical protein